MKEPLVQPLYFCILSVPTTAYLLSLLNLGVVYASFFHIALQNAMLPIPLIVRVKIHNEIHLWN